MPCVNLLGERRGLLKASLPRVKPHILFNLTVTFFKPQLTTQAALYRPSSYTMHALRTCSPPAVNPCARQVAMSASKALGNKTNNTETTKDQSKITKGKSKTTKGESIKLQTGPFGGPARYPIGRPVLQPSLDPREAPDAMITPIPGYGEITIHRCGSSKTDKRVGTPVPTFTNPWDLEERRQYVMARLDEARLRQEEAQRAEGARAAKRCCRCGCWSSFIGVFKGGRN